ncbi:MAG: carboxylating nicotinate-nucleotide diphosphorylase [Candidatus Omnitrophica bacterium]|nr:carboxylating nicotinate-nucleotide diphosphorylase [Candidatus Omnitrophota bacterium]
MAYGKIDAKKVTSIIKNALAEDIGSGDITTRLFIAQDKKSQARIIAQENFLLCGINIAQEVFRSVDSGLKFQPKIKEGSQVIKNSVIAVISGKSSSILTAERVALNFLSLLCGIATKTKKFVKAVAPYKTKIFDTRKTMPGLRVLEKYAVRVGGGYNHRFSLDEMILIKDNHLKITGGCVKLPKTSKKYKIEIETQNLAEFKRALSLKPDIIMLDNMSVKDIKQAVKLNKSCLLEASGGVNLGNIKKYASTGVEIISIGELTDSVESVDISLDIV